MVKQMFNIFEILAQLFLYVVLKWQLVNTPSFVMPACVEIFKTSVLQLAPR